MDVMTATDKWCPMAREITTARDGSSRIVGLAGTNREDESVYAHCIASDCMMWRYFKDSKTDGYCGLAGKPNG